MDRPYKGMDPSYLEYVKVQDYIATGSMCFDFQFFLHAFLFIFPLFFFSKKNPQAKRKQKERKKVNWNRGNRRPIFHFFLLLRDSFCLYKHGGMYVHTYVAS